MKKCEKYKKKCWIRVDLTQANPDCWAQFLFQPIENNERKKKKKSSPNYQT